jgi:hypothetical protein
MKTVKFEINEVRIYDAVNKAVIRAISQKVIARLITRLYHHIE